jgi:hypothetical protein
MVNFNDPFEANPVIIGGKNERIEVAFKAAGNTAWSPLSVASFSRRVNSGLLWGHYTSGYRGIALHFVPANAKNSPFSQSNFHWITYEKQRPYLSFERLKYYFNQNLPHPAGAFTPQVLGAIELQLMAALLTWKSDEWSYEQEARLIVASDATCIQYPSEELTSIILGPNCSSTDEHRIKTLLSKAPPHIRIAKAKLSGTDYSIEIDW